MNRVLAAIGAMAALAAADVITLSRTSVSIGWTILATVVALIAMTVTVSSTKRHNALIVALVAGAIPPALVVSEAREVALSVVLPALFLLLAGELAIFARDQISVVADDGKGGGSRLREIGATIGMAALGSLAVGIVGRLDLGSSPILIALGAMAIAALVYVLVPTDT